MTATQLTQEDISHDDAHLLEPQTVAAEDCKKMIEEHHHVSVVSQQAADTRNCLWAQLINERAISLKERTIKGGGGEVQNFFPPTMCENDDNQTTRTLGISTI